MLTCCLGSDAEVVSSSLRPGPPSVQQSIEAASAHPATRVVKAAPQAELLDINTATADQLKALPGMGAEYARRIVAGRPYSAKNQLVGRGVLPQPAYDRISGRIVAHRSR